MHRILFFIIIVFVTIAAACGNENKGSQPEKTVTMVKIDPLLRDTANLLGGIALPTNSIFAKTASAPAYTAWTNAFNNVWQRTQQPNLDLIKTWASTNLNRAGMPKTLFYPFSGPDILNAWPFSRAETISSSAWNLPADPSPDKDPSSARCSNWDA